MKIILLRKHLGMFTLVLCALSWIAANLSGCGAVRPDSSAQASRRVTSVIIAPQNPNIALGNNQQFRATAVFSDGSKTDVTKRAVWGSVQTNIATVSSGGLSSSKAVGSTSIFALYQAVRASSMLTINPAALVSITVAPQSISLTPNHSVQLSATGTFSDSTTRDLTGAVSWATSPAGIVTISPSSLLTAQALGAAIVTATSNALSAADTVTVVAPTLQSISVSPEGIALTPNHSVQLSAKGTFSDGTTQDLTRAVSWLSLPTGIVAISSSGLLTAQALGTTTVSATSNALRAVDTVTVVAPTLQSIFVSPQGISLTPNHSVQLSAKGTFSDGTTQDLTRAVSWLSSPTGIVAISSSGLLTAQALGTTTVSATSNAVSAADSITVVAPTLQSISVTSSEPSIPLGESLQLSATGQYKDGSTQNLTGSVRWASSDPAILSIGSSGMVTANAIGSVTVTAAVGTINGAAPLAVGPPVVISLKIVPATSLLVTGGYEQLSAFETLSDGTTLHMTGPGSWSSSKPSVADVSNQGFVVAQHSGSTTISISSDSVEGSATLTVKPLLAVSYFSHANTSGFADSDLRLDNPGATGGNLCAEIYVFDQDQQLSECCGCSVSPDGLLTLSVNSDLTANPLTGVKSTTGVIQIVSADVPANLSCDPTAITPNGELLAWSTNTQAKSGSAIAFTENSFQLSPLGDADLAALQSQCSMVATLGSGRGVCNCGAGAGNSVAHTRLP
jgi:hypothetical protein